MRKECQYTRPGTGLPSACRVTDEAPGKASQCSSVAPSCHCRLFTAKGSTPGGGGWGVGGGKRPGWGRLGGEVAVLPASLFPPDGCNRALGVVGEVDLAALVFAEATMRTDGRAISGISFV